MARKGESLAYLKAHMHDGCCAPWPYTLVHNSFNPRHKANVRPQMFYCGRRRYAYEVVLELTAGPKPNPEYVARHLCGKGHLGCFNAECLIWGTRKEDRADMRRHGTHQIRERNPRAKLSEKDVAAIRKAKGLIYQRELAAAYGVGLPCIEKIHQNRTWKEPRL